jgi:GH24 family phage-related lysozyme (muramidase)
MNHSRQQCRPRFKSMIYTLNRPGMTNSKAITIEQLFRYYKALPHQAAAIQELETDLSENGYDVAMRRDRGWFATWSQSGKQRNYQAAIDLTKSFEGFHHDAYLCPAGVWSIGWGNTTKADGSPVIPGDRISQEAGDALLQQTIDGIVTALAGSIPYWSAMKEHQQSALISFAYNVGSYFYGQQGFETISRCLRERTYKSVPEALLLYCNPGSNFEAGLTRRRAAEGQLWAGEQAAAPEPATIRPESPFSTRLTPHITLGEFALGQEARRFEHQYQVDMAAELAAFLERVRVKFGNKPIIITSGYRPPAINREVGGAFRSEHLFDGKGVGAVDFYVQDADIWAVQAYCEEHWPHSVGRAASRGFVHLGRREGGLWVRWDY